MEIGKGVAKRVGLNRPQAGCPELKSVSVLRNYLTRRGYSCDNVTSQLTTQRLVANRGGRPQTTKRRHTGREYGSHPRTHRRAPRSRATRRFSCPHRLCALRVQKRLNTEFTESLRVLGTTNPALLCGKRRKQIPRYARDDMSF